MTFFICQLSPLIQVACVVTKLGVGREEMCCSYLLHLQFTVVPFHFYSFGIFIAIYITIFN